MKQVIWTLGTLTVILTGTIACSPSGARVDGLDFVARDALYVQVDDARTPGEKNLVLIVSDVDDLCEHANRGDSFAGRAKLEIVHRYTGSVRFQFMKFDADCSVMHHEDTGQGWIETGDLGGRHIDASFTFVGGDTNVTGELTARSCTVPDGFFHACN